MFELLLSRCGCSSGGNVVVAMDEKIKVFNTTTHIVQVLFHWKNSERERSVNYVIHKEYTYFERKVLLVPDADAGISAPGAFFQGIDQVGR